MNTPNNSPREDITADHLSAREEKLRRLRAQGIDAYPAKYNRSHSSTEARVLFNKLLEAADPDITKTQPVSIAGRIMAVRIMGKNSFLDIKDADGHIQAHFRVDTLGESYALLKEIDIGDFLGVTGPIFKTRTGEITIEATQFTFLSKSLRSLPEKWHGLKDKEQRYRQRYLDLIANDEIMPVFLNRSRIIQSIRTYMLNAGFVEVDTPVLVPVAAGALAKPFVTRHHALGQNLYMRIATELYLKRLIVGGFHKVFEIGRVFRNEGIDQNHNPEFTLMESYEAYADYEDVMKLVENLLSTVVLEITGSHTINYGDHILDFSVPWKRSTFSAAILEHSEIDIEPYLGSGKNIEDLISCARDKGFDIQSGPPHQILDKLLSLAVEPNLIQPIFITDHPKIMSPLAKTRGDNPAIAERFEAFIGGMEIANAFSELNDPVEQRTRFSEQEEIREQYSDEEADRTDDDFLTSLEYGMPPTGGLGIGIDRIVMLLTNQQSIRDILLFPQMRSRDT